MLRISTFLLLLLFVFSGQSYAQTHKMDWADLANPSSLSAKSLRNLQWMGTTDFFTYNADGKTILKGSVKSAQPDTLLKLQQLNEAVKLIQITDLRSLPSYSWVNNDNLTFKHKGKVVKYCISKGTAQLQNSFSDNADNIEVDDVQNRVAFTRDNNLFVSLDGKEKAVTQDTDKGIVNGQSVHRNEFGIKGGIFWSPKGNLLAFYRMDERMVAEYPIVDVTQRIGTVKAIHYPMAGEASHQVTLGVYNPVTGSTLFLKTAGPDDHYLTNICWDPSEKFIYIAELNRDQNQMKYNKYSAETGEFVKTLFEETSPQYVEPLNPALFLKTKPNQFIWQSQRDGYTHLYLYDTEGNLIKQLTKGNWVVTNVNGFDQTERKLFYTSTAVSPIQRHLYALDVKSGATTCLTQLHGTHAAQVSADGHFVLDVLSSTDIAKRYDLIDATNGKLIRNLQEDVNPWKNIQRGEITVGTLKSKDGSDLYYRLTKPADFDPTKKYPVIFYVYGGPHSQLVTDTWMGGGNAWFQLLAAKGYVVFTLDNHGTSDRGFAFESIIHRNLGTIEVDDQMVGVNYLKSLPFVDASRMAVDGWSYGGFMTLSLMLKQPGVFKVATAGGPVIDWKYYEVMYGERYMDTPQENPEGYKNASLLNYAQNLKGRMLIIHGTSDNTVVWQNSLLFLKKCVEKGVQVDYYVYPGHEHNVSGPDRIHLYKKLFQYYEDHL
jgi:dipeptidyl-peptidase-4